MSKGEKEDLHLSTFVEIGGSQDTYYICAQMHADTE